MAPRKVLVSSCVSWYLLKHDTVKSQKERNKPEREEKEGKSNTFHIRALSRLQWSNRTHWRPAGLSQDRWSSESSWQSACQNWSCWVHRCFWRKHLWTACCGGAWPDQSGTGAGTSVQKGQCRHQRPLPMLCSWTPAEPSRWTRSGPGLDEWRRLEAPTQQRRFVQRS